MRLSFADTTATVQVPDCHIFLGALRAAFGDWPFQRLEPTVAAGREAPILIIKKAGSGYDLRMPGGPADRLTAVGAANRLVVAIVNASIDDHSERLCFHAASVLINGRLVLMPGRAKAGKSMLATRLAMAGHKVFGDDVLALTPDDREGVASGLALRLRLPLPPRAENGLRLYVERHSRVDDGRHAYLALPPERFAARGTTAALGAVVLLDRHEGEKARFAPAPKGAALTALVSQNFALDAPAGELLDRLHAVMERLDCLTLVYSDLEDAVRLIEATFSTWPPVLGDPAPTHAPIFVSRVESEDAPSTLSAMPPDRRMRQSGDVRLKRVDDELFIAGGHDGAIHQLNAIGGGIWTLLAEPASQADAVTLISAAFPDADPDAIAADVATVFGKLSSAGLILPAETETEATAPSL